MAASHRFLIFSFFLCDLIQSVNCFLSVGSLATSRGLHVTFAKADPAREATGIRPSLHPVAINAIAEAIKIRSRKLDDMPLQCTSDIQPIQVALTAGRIASEALLKRQQASSEDGMEFEDEEEQTIAGRVVGVVMRLPELESDLYRRCSSVSWIAKYNEWSSFGLLPNEEPDLLTNQVLSDPLFTLSRAECLLALYLDTVEKPSLDKIGRDVPDGSKIDFLDCDRREVLLSKV